MRERAYRTVAARDKSLAVGIQYMLFRVLGKLG